MKGDQMLPGLLPLVGRRVSVEALSWRHLMPAWRIASSAGAREGWPLFGQALSPEDFANRVWETGSVSCALVSRHDDSTIGLIQGLAERPVDQTIDLAVMVDPELWGTGWPVEGVVLFIDWLFGSRNLRKIYLRAPARELTSRVGGFGGSMVEEARLAGHLVRADGVDDVVIWALYRESWAGDLVRWVLDRRRDG